MVLSESDTEKIIGISTDGFLNTVTDRVAQILDKKIYNEAKGTGDNNNQTQKRD